MFSAEFFDVVDISKNCALIVIFRNSKDFTFINFPPPLQSDRTTRADRAVHPVQSPARVA